MNAFEAMVAEILKNDGFWVRPGFKVNLTKEEKRQIGRPSSPRWELDIVAYKGGSNQVLVVECKSYLDSPGVRFDGFSDPSSRDTSRYKLFNEPKLREVVFSRLATQLVEAASCAVSPEVQLCLAAGKIASQNDRQLLHDHFKKQGWMLWDDNWIRKKLQQMSYLGYEDEPSTIVAKLLLRTET